MDKVYTYRYPHPAITTDIVVFTIANGALKLLLIQRRQNPYKGTWALPGGFLEPNEGLDQCAQRELQEETGLKNIYLEQLYTFGEPDRDPRERVVSIGYYALVPSIENMPKAASDAVDTDWFSLDTLPPLAFDHIDIVDMAHKRLLSKLDYTTIAFQFLPEAFTLSEAQKIYEIVRNKRLDKRNFRKQITNMELIKETGGHRRDGNHRPARLYRATCCNKIEVF